MKEDAYWIRDQVQQHNKWFEESIPMIASENLMSPLAKEMMISDFHDRYAEGLPGKRYYNGNIFVDKVEIKCLELAQRIFKCQFSSSRKRQRWIGFSFGFKRQFGSSCSRC